MRRREPVKRACSSESDMYTARLCPVQHFPHSVHLKLSPLPHHAAAAADASLEKARLPRSCLSTVRMMLLPAAAAVIARAS